VVSGEGHSKTHGAGKILGVPVRALVGRVKNLHPETVSFHLGGWEVSSQLCRDKFTSSVSTQTCAHVKLCVVIVFLTLRFNF
jgi:hypothetical protein